MAKILKDGEVMAVLPLSGIDDYFAEQEGISRDDFDIEQNQAERDEASDQLKKKGELYAESGVTVPFTSQDAMGLLQVKAAFELGAASTTMLFSNGQKLPMTAEDFPVFAAWFTQKRNSFFQEA